MVKEFIFQDNGEGVYLTPSTTVDELHAWEVQHHMLWDGVKLVSNLSYQELRQNEYPSIQDQLDMMHNDLKNRTTTWFDLIEGIKTKYPKPKEAKKE